jgi:RND family efflux transporter MFP subunit
MTESPESMNPIAHATRRRFGPSAVVLAVLAVVLLAGGLLYRHAVGGVNKVALADAPRPVSTIAAVARPYQPRRRYVGTVEPWLQAKVGPQMVAAYVDTVLVRPGMAVAKGQVIATLDCRNASAQSRQVAAQARAVDATSTAAASEAARTSSLLAGKYVSQNEVDQKQAEAASKQAQLAALQAQQLGTALQVDDCVLRAPFDGEVAMRASDPGAFVRPGSSIATIVDRHILRITADVPEDDFAAVAPGTDVRVHLLATNQDLRAKISRRAPSADESTRTAHVEIDVSDPERSIPTWTTAEISIDVGAPQQATAVPLSASAVRGEKVQVYTVLGDVAKQAVVKLVGERGGTVFVDPKGLPAGTDVITQGRSTLSDGDQIAATVAPWQPDKPEQAEDRAQPAAGSK